MTRFARTATGDIFVVIHFDIRANIVHCRGNIVTAQKRRRRWHYTFAPRQSFDRDSVTLFEGDFVRLHNQLVDQGARARNARKTNRGNWVVDKRSRVEHDLDETRVMDDNRSYEGKNHDFCSDTRD